MFFNETSLIYSIYLCDTLHDPQIQNSPDLHKPCSIFSIEIAFFQITSWKYNYLDSCVPQPTYRLQHWYPYCIRHNNQSVLTSICILWYNTAAQAVYIKYHLHPKLLHNRSFSLTWSVAPVGWWNNTKYLNKKELIPVPYTNMAAISLFWYTNMAAVTSDENDLYNRQVWRKMAIKIMFV